MENTVLVPLSGFNEYRDVIGRGPIDPEVMYLFPPSLRELCPEHLLVDYWVAFILFLNHL